MKKGDKIKYQATNKYGTTVRNNVTVHKVTDDKIEVMVNAPGSVLTGSIVTFDRKTNQAQVPNEIWQLI